MYKIHSTKTSFDRREEQSIIRVEKNQKKENGTLDQSKILDFEHTRSSLPGAITINVKHLQDDISFKVGKCHLYTDLRSVPYQSQYNLTHVLACLNKLSLIG